MNHNTSIIACTAAAAVAVLSAATTFLSRASESAAAAPDPRLPAIEQGLAAQARELEGMRASLRQLADQWTAAVALRRAPVPEVVEPARAPAPEVGKAPEARPRGENERKSFRSALAHMFRNGNADAKLGEAEQAEFWKLARTTGLVDEVMAELETAVSANPRDVQARMELADTYTAKLLTIPGGPEQGVWGGKAEKQWLSVLEQQPEHWEARFALGFNYSMYPSFVDRSKEAIVHLTAAKQQLLSMPAEPKQVETYTALARMYTRQQKGEQARAVLAEGLERFPGDERLLRARELSGSGERR